MFETPPKTIFIDPGINLGYSIIDIKQKEISLGVFKYKNTQEMFQKVYLDMSRTFEVFKPLQCCIEFSPFGHFVSQISHFGLVSLLYNLVHRENIKWLTDLPNKKNKNFSKWGIPPNKINRWASNKLLNVKTKDYDDKEALKLGLELLTKFKDLKYKIKNDKLITNVHVADSLVMGTFYMEEYEGIREW